MIEIIGGLIKRTSKLILSHEKAGETAAMIPRNALQLWTPSYHVPICTMSYPKIRQDPKCSSVQSPVCWFFHHEQPWTDIIGGWTPAFAQGNAKDFWKPPSRLDRKPMAKTTTFMMKNLKTNTIWKTAPQSTWTSSYLRFKKEFLKFLVMQLSKRIAYKCS